MTTTHVFADTSILMQFKRPDEIPWLELTGSKDVVIVFAPKVVSELDVLKTSNDIRKRKRAAMLLKWLRELSRDDNIREGVRAKFLVVEPTSFREHELSPDVSDDRILATLLLFIGDLAGGAVMLATADFGLELKARHQSVHVLPVPDQYELPPPDTSEEAKLRKELNELKSRRIEPQLLIETPQGGGLIEVEQPSVLVQSDSQIGDEVQEERLRLTRAHWGVPTVRVSGPDDDDDEDEDDEDEDPHFHEKHLSRLTKYLKRVSERNAIELRTTRIRFTLSNRGKAPATNVSVQFEGPPWVKLVSDPELPDVGERPVWNPAEEIARLIFPRVPVHDFMTSQVSIPQFDGFSEKNSAWFERRLPHGSNVDIEFYAQIDPDHAIENFHIEAEVHADECPESLRQTLHIVRLATPQEKAADPAGDEG